MVCVCVCVCVNTRKTIVSKTNTYKYHVSPNARILAEHFCISSIVQTKLPPPCLCEDGLLKSVIWVVCIITVGCKCAKVCTWKPENSSVELIVSSRLLWIPGIPSGQAHTWGSTSSPAAEPAHLSGLQNHRKHSSGPWCDTVQAGL